MGKMIEEKLETLTPYELDGTIDNAIEVLQLLKDRYAGKDIRLVARTANYSEDVVLAVIWKRPENDNERDNRLKQEEWNKKYRLAEYQRLKKEFGD